MKRNKERLLELADFIEKAEFKFDMGDPVANPTCGTAGCMAGHAAVLWPELRTEGTGDGEIFSWKDEELAAYLDITEDEHDLLFYPQSHNEGAIYGYIDRDVAVGTLRHFASTGEIIFNQTNGTVVRLL